MERTGHVSTEGIRSYKRTSSAQLEEVSNILNNVKKPCMEVAVASRHCSNTLDDPPLVNMNPAGNKMCIKVDILK